MQIFSVNGETSPSATIGCSEDGVGENGTVDFAVAPWVIDRNLGDGYEEAKTTAAGEQRCPLDAGFFGPYAASSPEQAFAEAFSAYVFQLEPDSRHQQQFLGWIDTQPGRAEFRDRAVQAGLGPLPTLFDYCG